MKSAMLITAYKDFDILTVLLKYYSRYYSCYLHVDKKVSIPETFRNQVKSMQNVKMIQEYTINWGSYRHICAFLKLLHLAYEDGCEYFHLIPADTFPVKDIETTKKFFAEHSEINFIECLPADKIVLERQSYFYFQHLYNLKSDRGYWIEQHLLSLQKKIGIQRKAHFFRKGYVYCHISKEFAEYIFKYLKEHPEYMRRLRTYSIPEEFFFQNLMTGSMYENYLINDHQIYDQWQPEAGGPSPLTFEQIGEALASEKMFARKINTIDKAEYVLQKIKGKGNE